MVRLSIPFRILLSTFKDILGGGRGDFQFLLGFYPVWIAEVYFKDRFQFLLGFYKDGVCR